jgi:hypothetical protein
MPRGRSKEDHAMLEMALVGYEHERERIVSKIRELQTQLKGEATASARAATPVAKPGSGKRVLSPAARKRIAAAQKKRWAEHRKRLAAEG